MFRQKKLILIPILIATMFLMTSLVFADGEKEAKVIGDNLNVRTSPDLSAEILTRLQKGVKVNKQ